MKRLGLLCCILLLLLTGCSEKTKGDITENSTESLDTMTKLYAKEYLAWPFEENKDKNIMETVYTDVYGDKFYAFRVQLLYKERGYRFLLETYDTITSEKIQKELFLLDEIEGKVLYQTDINSLLIENELLEKGNIINNVGITDSNGNFRVIGLYGRKLEGDDHSF